MATDRNLSQEMRRWLRVATFTLTALGPVINILGKRMRDRAETHTETHQEEAAARRANLDPQEQLILLGTNLAEALAELRTRRYKRKLVKRGEKMAEELVDRGRKLSRTMIESGSDISQELFKRGKKARRGWSRSRARMTNELRKRKASQTPASRSPIFWLALILSAGLTTAGIALYLYMQRRRQQQETDENQPIELSQNDRWDGNAPKEQMSMAPVAPDIQEPSITAAESDASSLPAVDESQSESAEQTLPENATVIGVVSTRLYYPIEVPLEQLTLPEDETDIVTVVYFTSEDEEQARGFTAATAQ